MNSIKSEVIVFGGGCFWCTEAVFSRLRGVVSVKPGYSGGITQDPSYESVSGGGTRHAEVVRIEYDPSKIKFRDLLTVFFAIHDPTILNRQGNDVGTQYRSAIFYTNNGQKKEVESYIKKLEKKYNVEIVTEVTPFTKFYMAESHDLNYFEKNKDKPYCQLVIVPKLQKLKEEFNKLLKKN